MIAAILFDLDGTLVDTAPDMALTVNRMLERRGLPAVATESVRPHVSKGARGMIGAAFGLKPGDEGFEALREEFLALYGENLCVGSRLFPGMAELLDTIEARGIAWGVVTNKFERFAVPLIDALGLARRAAIVVGGDTCPRPKPFPDPLLFAAERMRIAPPSVLYVGDDERDVLAAHAAGMPVLAAAYGYLGDEKPPELWGADAIVDSPGAIARWLLHPTIQEAHR